MSCGFDKGLIAAYYDREVDGDERAEVERHLATCAECARDLAGMKDVTGALKSLGKVSADPLIEAAVVHEVHVLRPGRPRFGLPWKLLATAAALMIAVGTYVLVQDRQAMPPGENFALAPRRTQEAPLVSERKHEDLARGLTDRSEVAKTPAAEPAPPLARRDGGIEGKGRDAEAGLPAPSSTSPEKKSDDLVEKIHKDAPRDAKPSVPVIQVTSAEVALARAEVEAFLKERELATKPGAPLLGQSAYVKDHYLQVELTDEEVALLEKRLAALKKTGIARGTLEAERKRVEEAEAALDMDRKRSQGEPAPAEAQGEGRTGAAAAKAKEEDSRENLRALGGATAGRRAKVILVFLEPPAKK